MKTTKKTSFVHGNQWNIINTELTLSQLPEGTKISFRVKKMNNILLKGYVWNQNKDFFFARADLSLNPGAFKGDYNHQFFTPDEITEIKLI